MRVRRLGWLVVVGVLVVGLLPTGPVAAQLGEGEDAWFEDIGGNVLAPWIKAIDAA